MDLPEITEAARLALKPGDILALRYEQALNMAEADDIEKHLRAVLPHARVLIFDACAGVSVIAPEAAGVIKQAALAVLLESGFDPFNARAALGIGPEADGALCRR